MSSQTPQLLGVGCSALFADIATAKKWSEQYPERDRGYGQGWRPVSYRLAVALEKYMEAAERLAAAWELDEEHNDIAQAMDDAVNEYRSLFPANVGGHSRGEKP